MSNAISPKTVIGVSIWEFHSSTPKFLILRPLSFVLSFLWNHTATTPFEPITKFPFICCKSLRTFVDHFAWAVGFVIEKIPFKVGPITIKDLPLPIFLTISKIASKFIPISMSNLRLTIENATLPHPLDHNFRRITNTVGSFPIP